jgi:hypothetical protein
MDVDAIEPGEDFVDAIQTSVASADALVAVIGKSWLGAIDPETGRRRLDEPNDYVRLEIKSALDRRIRVIPVLVQGATMPSPVDLPDDLAPLTRRNALDLSDLHWKDGVDRLIQVLQKVMAEPSVPEQAADSRTTEAVERAPARTREFRRLAPAPTPAARAQRSSLPLVLGVLALALLGAGIAVAAVLLGGGDEEVPAASSVILQTVTTQGETEVVTVTTEAEPTAPPEETPPQPTAPSGQLTIAQAKALQDASTVAQRQGEWGRALDLALQALAVLNNTGDRYEAYANFNVGKSLAELGRCAEALPYLERRQALGPPDPQVPAAIRQCGG